MIQSCNRPGLKDQMVFTNLSVPLSKHFTPNLLLVPPENVNDTPMKDDMTVGEKHKKMIIFHKKYFNSIYPKHTSQGGPKETCQLLWDGDDIYGLADIS